MLHDPATMPRIAVFKFEVFDRNTRAWILASFRATPRYIDAFGGVILPNTQLLVSPAEVDASGIHRPALLETGTEVV